MKKALSFTILLLIAISINSFSQDKKEQVKTKIKPALLVIDIQNEFLPMIPDREKEVGMYMINELIKLFRSNGFPVIRVYHTSKELVPKPGTDAFEFPSSVLIKPDDPKVIKNYPDGFNKTDLDDVIKKTDSNTLFLCGLSSVGCVLATWIGAFNHDYQAFLVKDAIMSHNSGYTDNVEVMFDAVGYDMIKLIVENADK